MAVLLNGVHHRAEHHGKQRADVEHDQHIADEPGHIAGHGQDKGKNNVAAKIARGSGRLSRHARDSWAPE
jgi:hypothetical protein